MMNDLPEVTKYQHGLFADGCAFWEVRVPIPEIETRTQYTLNEITGAHDGVSLHLEPFQ